MTTVDHPLLDAAGPGWAGTETRTPVIALTTAMSDWLHKTATQGLRPIVVSGEHSRMTQPLAQVLSAVAGALGRPHARRRLLRRPQRRAALRPADALAAGAPTPDSVHPFFVRAQVASTLQVVTTVSTRHRVTRPVRLGGVAEAAIALFTDAEPAAWGAVEPLLAPWDRDDLTERTRRRIPLDSHWAAVGGGERAVVATLQAARTSEGLEETTRCGQRSRRGARRRHGGDRRGAEYPRPGGDRGSPAHRRGLRRDRRPRPRATRDGGTSPRAARTADRSGGCAGAGHRCEALDRRRGRHDRRKPEAPGRPASARFGRRRRVDPPERRARDAGPVRASPDLLDVAPHVRAQLVSPKGAR